MRRIVALLAARSSPRSASPSASAGTRGQGPEGQRHVRCSSSPSTTSTATSRPPAGRPVDAARVGAMTPAGPSTSPTHVERRSEPTNANTIIVVGAGDLIGASPLISALFHDEPTIEAMNPIGLDVNARRQPRVRRRARRALRMQNGGCHPSTAARTATVRRRRLRLPGGERRRRGRPARRSSRLTRSGSFNGAKVAFIGMTLEGTPDIVTPTGVAGLDFRRRGRRRSTRSSRSCGTTGRASDRRPPPRGRLRRPAALDESTDAAGSDVPGRLVEIVDRGLDHAGRRRRQRPHAPAVQLRDRRQAASRARRRSAG